METTNTVDRDTRSDLEGRRFHLPIPHYAEGHLGHCDYPVWNKTVSVWSECRHVVAVTSHLTGRKSED